MNSTNIYHLLPSAPLADIVAAPIGCIFCGNTGAEDHPFPCGCRFFIHHDCLQRIEHLETSCPSCGRVWVPMTIYVDRTIELPQVDTPQIKCITILCICTLVLVIVCVVYYFVG